MLGRIRAPLPHGEVAEVLILDVADDALWVAGSGDEDGQTADGATHFSQLGQLHVVSRPKDFLVQGLAERESFRHSILQENGS